MLFVLINYYTQPDEHGSAAQKMSEISSWIFGVLSRASEQSARRVRYFLTARS